MYYIQGFVVILAACLTSCISQWDEEKRSLSEAELKSNFFRQLLEQANEKCNLASNETIWYKQEGIIGGSKQSEIICQIEIWHNPKTNTSTVKVREIWMIKNSDTVIAETVHVSNENERGLDRALIEEAIMNLNNYGKKPKLFKYSRSVEITLQVFTLKTYPMRNFARSDIRFLSTEEVHEQSFQDLLKIVMRRYNSGSFSENVSKAIKVENAHIESGRDVITKFTLWAQETPCKKQSNLLMNDDNFATVCKIPDELPIKRPAETCDVKVTKVNSISANGYTVELRNYKFIPNYNLSLYREMQYVQRGTAEDKIKMKIAKRVVERYNTEHNDLYKYQLESIQNAKWMISAGRLFSMNVTMEAFACKNKNDISCANLLKQVRLVVVHVYRHCEASALDRPWPFKEAINFTNCWKETILRQSVKGVWSLLSSRELSQMQSGEMFKSIVKKYRDGSMILGQMKNYQLSGGFKLMGYECEVALVQQKGKPNEIYLHRCILRPSSDGGNQEAGSKKIPVEQKRLTFQSKLRNIVELYNNISNDVYYHRLFDIEEPVTQFDCWSVRRAWQLDCKRFITNRGDIISAGLSAKLGEQTNNQSAHPSYLYSTTLPVQSLYRFLKELLFNKVWQHTTSCVANIFENPSNASMQINLQDCKLSKMTDPIRVQSTSDDLQASNYFRELLSNAVLAFNLKSDAKLLYQSHLVEAIVRSEENPSKLHFTLILSQTSCRKWEDVLAFRLDRNELCHTDPPAPPLVLCKVNIVEFDKRTEINLDNCKYIHGGNYALPRPQNARERSTTLFQQVVQNAVSLFNHQTDSEYWFNLVAVENPTIEQVFGIQYTFTLHMLPAQCLIIKSPDGTAEYVSREHCNYIKPDFMVSCRARFWRRAWNDLHETLDVSDCDLIPISHTWSAGIENTSPLKELGESTMYCLESIARRLVELFAEQQNLGQPYEIVSIENVVEYLVPGKRLTFDLYMKPASMTQKCSFKDARKCGVKKEFFKCLASYWWKDWKEQETLELFNCTTVSSQAGVRSLIKGVSAVDDPELEEMGSKVVGIYNEKVSKFYIFGKETIDNITQK
ncbi:putative cys1 protein, partial [Clonorchis sinensis]